jgi:hypothetical protein
MPIPKLINAQRDFSAGELDEAVKRADELPTMKAGGREMRNWRILSSKAIQNRPGRSALFPIIGGLLGRIEEFSMGNQVFYIGFSGGTFGIFNSVGTLVFVASTFLLTPAGSPVAIPWTQNSVGGIVWAQNKNTIYIAYPDGAPNNVPQVLSWDGVSIWTLAPYTESVTYGGQKRTLFYRLSPPNITLLPSATTGNINITFSNAVLSAGMVGTRLQYCGEQLTITGVSSATAGTATVNEPLPPGETLTYTTLNGQLNIGDVVKGSITGATGIVISTAATQVLLFGQPGAYPSVASVGDTVTQAATTSTGLVTGTSYYFDGTIYAIWLTVAVSAGGFTTGGPVVGPLGTHTPADVTNLNTTAVTVQLIPVGDTVIQFAGTETVVGPSGNFAMTGHSIIGPQAVAVWDDEVMNTFRGYPSSVFFDQSRLGFTNFPAVPQGIAWSAIGLPNDLLVGALADNAIFELAPDNSQVFYVIPGMESSEFVFTDRAIYYIPITPTVPLEPGSIAFNKLSDYGCMPHVQPRRAEQSIIYIKAGGVQVGAVQAPGAYYRPYVVDHISELHSHLFTASSPMSIAIPSGPTQFEEQYLYIALANGTLVVGRYAMRQGLIEPGPEGKPAIGWLPWDGTGNVKWVAARQGDVIFSSTYAPNGVPQVSIIESLNNSQYLDGALFVNNLPAAFTPPGGKGPLYVFPGPNSSVFLIDLGTLFLGVYNVDANGFIIAQGNPGENLASSQLVAGQSWNSALEIFLPGAQPGQSVHQRMTRRRIARMAAYVSNSSGFYFGWIYNGPIGPALPTPGILTKTRVVPAYTNMDNPALPAPLREEVQRWRPTGRIFDPRVGIGKVTPGPLIIHELSVEVTV